MKSLAELQALRNKERAKLGVRSDEGLIGKQRVIVSMGTSGIVAGARRTLGFFVEAVANEGLYETVVVEQSTCVGSYGLEPMVTVAEADGTETVYVKIDEEKAKKIMEQHIKAGKVVTEYTNQ